jgi:hypothetical protein
MKKNSFFKKITLFLILIGGLFLFVTPVNAACTTQYVCSNDPSTTLDLPGSSCSPVTVCDSPPSGGGALPPDADEFLSYSPVATTSAKKINKPAPIGGCWKNDPRSRIVPITWYWPVYKNVHLQIYDSTGAWWFNGWVKSNSYTVYSKDGKGQFPGVPTDGRTVYAKVSYGKGFSTAGAINCSIHNTPNKYSQSP